MNIFVLLGTVVTSTVVSAFSVLQPPVVESTELRPLVVETIIEERAIPSLSPSPTPSIEPEATTAAETIVLVELHESMQSMPETGTDGETAQLVRAVIPTHTPSPTATPTATPTIKQATPTPTVIPSPTSTPTTLSVVKGTLSVPTPTTTSLISTAPAAPPPRSLNSDAILSLINAHRAMKGLPTLEKEDRLCALAQSRGPELYDEIFVNHNVHAGFYSRKLPYWITENMAHYGSEEAIVSWWLGSTIHRKAIEGNYQYSCGACYGNSCAQLFTNYIPK